jgi:hypothetical protein
MIPAVGAGDPVDDTYLLVKLLNNVKNIIYKYLK